MEWYRRYTDRTTNRKLFKAGFLGALVFDALCDISAEFDLGGELPCDYCDPAWLAHRMRLDQACADGIFFGGDDADPNRCEPQPLVVDGLNRCIEAGLVTRKGDEYLISGWEERQPKVPEKSTLRVQNHRSRLAAKRNETGRNTMKRDETDIEKENENEKETLKSGETASPVPLVDQVNAFGALGLTVTPKRERRRDKRPERRKDEKTRTRFAVLRDALCAAFLANRGEKYNWLGPKDGEALNRLMAANPGDEAVIAKWNVGLRGAGYLRVSTVAQLAAKWNDLTGNTGPPGGAVVNIRKSPVPAEAMPAEAMARTGDATSEF